MKRLLILAAVCIAMGAVWCQVLRAQYSTSVFSVKKAQDLYDENGAEHGSAVNVDGNVNVSASSGAVAYSYPISAYNEGGYGISVSLNYCPTVAFTAYTKYNLASRAGGGGAYGGWAKFHQNRPLWCVSVNGFAIDAIATTSHFHVDPASAALNPAFDAYGDKDFNWTIDGYDCMNRMRDLNPAGSTDTYGYTDVIRILRGDGSLLDLYNGHKDSTADPDTRPELYTGFYHSNTADDASFGVVSYDSTYWMDYLTSFVFDQVSDGGHRAPLVPRILHYYTADGLEYTFREWLIPFGLSAYEDTESRSGGMWGHPSIFYLEEIRSNAGTLVSFHRTRQYPKTHEFLNVNELLYTYDDDVTRGRALITSWPGHQISFGYNSMLIEALGRTTQVKFDTILRSGTAEPWEYFPWANNGGMTPASSQLAGLAEDNAQLYKSFVGYVTKIVDPEGRVTSFDYEPVTRIYEDLGFPHANPGIGHQTLTLNNYRLKSVTEPTARYTIRYKAASGRHITTGEDDQPTLNDVVDSVKKYDPWGALLTTDAYDYSTFGSTKVTTVRTADKVTGLEKSTTYHFDYFYLGFMAEILPPGRFTYLSQVDETADDGHGGTTGSSTSTHYVQDTVPGSGPHSTYVILPSWTNTTVGGVPKSYTSFSYVTDTVNRFGGDVALAGKYGLQTTRKITRTCRPDHPATVLLTDTTDYVNYPLVDSVMTWRQWLWLKLPSIANYLALRDSHDVRVLGKRWEDVMFAPPVAVIEPDTITGLVHMPPVYGLVRQSWVSDSTGCIGGAKHTYLSDVTALDARKVRDLLVADTILGRDKKSLFGNSYTHTAGWTGNVIASKTNALGVTERYSYDDYWATSDSLQFVTGTNDHPQGLILSHDDSVRSEELTPGSFGVWLGKPVAVRNVVRKYDVLGTLYSDTLTDYLQRTFYGLVSGSLDANGWLSRSEFDQNGRVTTVWAPGDFAHLGAYDTVSYSGTQHADLFGQTWYNRRVDSLHCYKDGDGTVIGDTITGSERNTLLGDTLLAFLPVTTIPVCPCKAGSGETKEKHARSIQQTCDAYFPYNVHAGYYGFYGMLNHMLDEESPIMNATHIDSMFLELAVSSVDGGCVHLQIDVDTLFSTTYVFNCGVGPEPVSGGEMLRIDLTSIASALQSRPLGSLLTTRISTTTAGASVTFLNGSSSEDLRPRYTVYGTYHRIADRNDYTLAVDHDDANLAATTTAKVDDRWHTSNVYNDSVVHGAAVRRTSAKHYFGADGRLLRSEATIAEDAPRAARVDTTFQHYTGLGAVRSTRNADGDTSRTNYDGFGRAIETINHDSTNATVAFTYGTESTFGITDQDFFGYCFATTMTNEDGVKHTTYTDAFDRVRREVSDSNGLHYTTTFEYDLAGHLTQAVDPKGDTTRYWYDEFGRVQYKRQPDIGIVSYAYDQLGRVRFSQDNMQGQQQRVTFNEYDDLGRTTLIGEAYFNNDEGGGYTCDGDYDEDDNYGNVPCDEPYTRAYQKGTPPARAKRAGRSSLSVLGDDPASDRLTNTLNPDTLHTWPAASLPTANPTVWGSPAVTMPTIPSAYSLIASCAGLQADTLLGETSAPVGPFIMRPTTFYSAPERGAEPKDFENVGAHPEFVRMAVAYDTIPESAGAIWANFPGQAQWDALAPRGAVRNQRGREAAVAYRERGSEPFHYAVMSFDERGRVEALMHYTAGLGFDAVYYTYNSMNAVTSVSTADYLREFTTWYGYDGAGRIDTVWSALGTPGTGMYHLLSGLVYPSGLTKPDTADIVYRYTKTGQLDSMSYPPANVLVAYAYNHRSWLDSLVATRGGSNLFREVLAYDATGQITQQIWKQGSAGRQRQQYGYDSLQRLTSWTQGPANPTTSIDTTYYTYDATGNRLTSRLSSFGQTENYLISPFTAEGNQLNSRRRFNGTSGDTVHGYTYDFNGALNGHTLSFENEKEAVNQSGEQYAYSYRGMLRRAYTYHFVSGAFKDWRYRYNASGEREEKRLYDANANDSAMKYPWTYYLLGAGNAQLAVYHGQQTRKTMCGDSGRRVYLYPVEYITNGVGYTGVPENLAQVITKPNGAKEYRVSDHLASLRVAIEGATTRTMDNDPWGNPLSGSATGERSTFNDQERDPETGLYDLSARKLDGPRFTSIDPWWEKFRAESPYNYCSNNPVRLTDPTGLGNPRHISLDDDVTKIDALGGCDGGGTAVGGLGGSSGSSGGNVGGGGGSTPDAAHDVNPNADGSGERQENRGKANPTSESNTPRTYPSYRAFKAEMGSAGEGMEWHHIVEQCQDKTRSGKGDITVYEINSTVNVVKLDEATHSKISALYSRVLPGTNNLPVRQWLKGQSFAFQYAFGLRVLSNFGVKVGK